MVDMGRTLGPHRPNKFEPSLQFLPELPWTRVVGASELADQAELAKKRNSLSTSGRVAPIGKPCEQVEGCRARRQSLGRFEIRRNWMAGDFPIELFAQNDDVLAIAGQEGLFQISRIPDSRLRHKVEAGAMNHRGPVPLSVRAEKNRRAENALERSDQPPVLGTALLDTEGIEHFGGAAERDPRGLLPNCHRSQKDRNQPILSPWKPIAWVAGDL
jgi:hypothetical protein